MIPAQMPTNALTSPTAPSALPTLDVDGVTVFAWLALTTDLTRHLHNARFG